MSQIILHLLPVLSQRLIYTMKKTFEPILCLDAYFDALLALFPSLRYHWNNNPLQRFKEASVEPLNVASFTQATSCPLFPVLSLPR